MDNKDIITGSEGTEKHRNRREWVKNVIIVFLLVMLILTFFSNTIMNYSLPEVSVARIARSKVSKGYSVDLVVQANKTYSVTADETRDIKRVAVRKGQEVKEGQTLFFLEEMKDSTEVKTLEDSIDLEKASYEKALITASPDNFSLAQAVEVARDKLNQAIDAKNNAASIPEPDPNEQKNELAEKAVLNSDLANITDQKFDTLSEDTRNRLSPELAAYEKAEAELKTADDDCSKYLADIQRLEAENGTKAMERNIETQKLQLEQKKTELAAASDAVVKSTLSQEIATLELNIKYAEEDLKEANDAIAALAKANTAKTEKTTAFDKAKKDFDRKVAAVTADLNARIASLGGSSDAEMPGVGGGSSLIGDTAVDYDANIRSAQYELEAAINALEQKRKTDSVTDAQAQVDLDAQKKKIDKLEADLEKLLSKQSENEIKAAVDGVVEEIKFASGQSFAPGEELMILNISADGFTSTATVTAEQAKAVKKGTEAKVTDNSDAKVTVKNIVKNKNDSGKFDLTFTVEGDVVADQTIKAELGGSASQFDKVVPKTAVKKDSSGYYVYAVKSKSTPLGNRYLAEKIAVTIVAEDDTQYAISGDLGDSADYIITASSKPFSAGDQVRFTQE